MILILMGVTGTGKTAVGLALAKATGWPFANADDFHSQSNRDKMHAGIALTDEDRAPWLESLHEQIMQWIGGNQNAILACSALKASYRTTLAGGTPGNSVRFVYLSGPESLIRQRMEARHGHYMPESLLPSQLATLEPPHNAIEVSIAQPIPAMVQEILKAIGVPAGRAYAGD